MQPNQALDLLNLRLTEHGLAASGWTGKLDNAVRRFGSCSSTKKVITLSRHLTTINTDRR
jgi:hypothetical protein